ncbi:CDP-glycerol glycerophosphotransferase family protein [Dokdonella sp.]|uniref:CDP-glycerol glycerophosphotransferase family protein n=1 Tax=Dokdonella sp. TaxID=2291710 RepID=UPI001B00C2EE|nr:CDP-glycerol glycerophosphotransferase family protein [Dokdonella sp.]MBO9661855.1 CDP-glycerol glycerophosphotransferase family protein [Dokdonella sp.]
MFRYLLFATELYALPILRPLEAAIRARGGEAAWFLPGTAATHLREGERRLTDARAVAQWAPQAVLAASNWAPHFFPGAKVQLFHGFNVEKRADQRGHFRIRGLFDLYCTQGPATTAPFRELARAHGHFAVVETGWPKLDPLFATDGGEAAALRPADGRPVVLYASTFTESLSSAPLLREEIARQIAGGERYWLLTLHPKSDPRWIAEYRALAGPNARFVESDALIPALRAADVLVSDTSSVVSEFAVQRKPVVTLRNRAPKPHMIDIQAPEELGAALTQAFSPSDALQRELAAYADSIHPWRDGGSSGRVLDAVASLHAGDLGPLARKPANLWRKWQIRSRLKKF